MNKKTIKIYKRMGNYNHLRNRKGRINVYVASLNWKDAGVLIRWMKFKLDTAFVSLHPVLSKF